MGLVSLQWDLKSETYQGISDWELHCMVLLFLYGVLFLTRDVAFLFNTICLRVVNRLPIIWVSMTYQIMEQYLPPIHFCEVVHVRCYISHCFCFFLLYFLFLLFFYDFLLVDLCFLFLLSCILTVVWATKDPFQPVCFLSNWSLNFIIVMIMVLLRYIVAYYITKLHYSRLFYLIVPLLFI